jgi:hypothetical protein
MSYPGTREANHKDNVKRKADRVEGLSALLAMHEKSTEPDFVYIEQLRERLKVAKNQFKHMRP